VGYYLLDHPNRTQQYRYPRRRRLSGTVVVHDTESIIDLVLPDYGAENTANFIVNRSDYGSYHELHDSDSVIPMAPDNYETWHAAAQTHDGTVYNWFAWGISAACRTTNWSASPWNPNYWWTVKVIASMGRSIRAFWERNGFDVNACARWLTQAEGDRQLPGLIHHGVAQPEDRSDAWTKHPERAALDAMLITAIKGSSPTPVPTPTPQDWFDMATYQDLVNANKDHAVISAIAKEVRVEINGWLDAQRSAAGQNKGDGLNLDDVVAKVTDIVLDQLDPNRGTDGPNPEATAIRTLVESVYNDMGVLKAEVAAVKAKVGA
jgi:hypothetical protein